jgi:hypothetical protein
MPALADPKPPGKHNLVGPAGRGAGCSRSRGTTLGGSVSVSTVQTTSAGQEVALLRAAQDSAFVPACALNPHCTGIPVRVWDAAVIVTHGAWDFKKSEPKEPPLDLFHQLFRRAFHLNPCIGYRMRQSSTRLKMWHSIAKISAAVNAALCTLGPIQRPSMVPAPAPLAANAAHDSCSKSQGCCSACAAVGRKLGSTVSSVDRNSMQPSSAGCTRAAKDVRFGRSTLYCPCKEPVEFST